MDFTLTFVTAIVPLICDNPSRLIIGANFFSEHITAMAAGLIFRSKDLSTPPSQWGVAPSAGLTIVHTISSDIWKLGVGVVGVVVFGWVRVGWGWWCLGGVGWGGGCFMAPTWSRVGTLTALAINTSPQNCFTMFNCSLD